MRSLAPCFALTIALCLILTTPGAAVNYTVDAAHPSASDANPGTPAEPLLTVARGVELAMPGDTVFITGLYHEMLYTERDGSAGMPIVFAAAPGSEAILDGSSGDPGNNGVVSTHSYLRFEGLEIRNWNDNGMWFEGGTGIHIRDCEVHHVMYGIGMTDGCHDFMLERVTMHDFDLYGFDASPGNGSCYNGTFIECVAHTGRDPEQNVDGFALGHGDQHGFTFVRCETWGVYDGFDISSRETTLDRCSAHDCLNGGYKLWQDDILLLNCLGYHNANTNVELDWDGEPGSVALWNCTFHDAATFNVWIENSADSLFMHNCIVSGGDVNGLAFELQDTQNYFGDFNLFHNDNPDRMINVGYEDQYTPSDLAAWTAASGQDEHSIALSDVTGEFIDAPAYDLHLQGGSQARDHGLSTGAPMTDFDGNTRPDGTAVDIGAFEYQSSSGIGILPVSSGLTLDAWPNPAAGPVRFHVAADRRTSAALLVYDLHGRLLHRQEVQTDATGAICQWDGCTDDGTRIRGLCVVVLRTSGDMAATRIVLW